MQSTSTRNFIMWADMVGLLDALGEQSAVVAGHDWGAPVAWNCALLRPDRFRATTIRRMLFGASGDAPRGLGHALEAGPNVGMVDRRAGFLHRMPEPQELPSWLTAADIDYYAAEFTRTGFRGGLNWYRNVDRSWEFLAPYAGAKVTVPALYVAGDRDVVMKSPGVEQLLTNFRSTVPQLRKQIMLPGCGHWTQQERASEVNAAMIEFLKSL